ncbi:hypothetical protein O181_036201 [Austropuccinia psidii MF-1]|uniref:DUF4219 domain-containing protein n=1 Tax=Austropuccinia psidii MF-1 TaxID=1389203 RepID=A0A9Q3D3Z3_9BASI|nr:hypothetical protein [Austropuccinia psidii MF-1]
MEGNIKISSIPLLGGSNYGEWHPRITIFLRSKDLLHVCEGSVASDASTAALSKWNKSMFDGIVIITSPVRNRVLIEVVKQNLTNAHLLWTKIQEKYVSKKSINHGRVWMQWLNSTYNGNLQEYMDKNRKLMMEMGTVNIIVPSKLFSFTLLRKLSGDPKIHQYVEALSVTGALRSEEGLALSKLGLTYGGLKDRIR